MILTATDRDDLDDDESDLMTYSTSSKRITRPPTASVKAETMDASMVSAISYLDPNGFALAFDKYG